PLRPCHPAAARSPRRTPVPPRATASGATSTVAGDEFPRGAQTRARKGPRSPGGAASPWRRQQSTTPRQTDGQASGSSTSGARSSAAGLHPPTNRTRRARWMAYESTAVACFGRTPPAPHSLPDAPARIARKGRDQRLGRLVRTGTLDDL